MSTHVNFTYEWEGNTLPSGTEVEESLMLDVEAIVSPYVPMVQPSLSDPGAPEEGLEIEHLEIKFDNEPWPLDHPTYHSRWSTASGKIEHNILVPLREALLDHIYDQARAQQDCDEYSKGYDG